MRILRAAMMAGALMAASAAGAQTPDYYPADYAKLVEAAKAEGRVVIYGTTAIDPVVADFKQAFPGIQVEFNDFQTTVLYNRFISEMAAGGSGADVIWSSAMDLQMKLVKDGQALSYASPEAPKLPAWAQFQNQLYSATYEPMVMVYNKNRIPPDKVPKTHDEFIKLLRSDPASFKGRVAFYDIEKSGLGFLVAVENSRLKPNFWDIPRAFGAVEARFPSGSGPMVEATAAGELSIAFDQFSTNARTTENNPNAGVKLLEDYTIVMSRVAFINKAAKNPNAAKLFLDYFLSKRGQIALAGPAGLYSIRDDVEGDYARGGLEKRYGATLKPVKLDESLLETLKPAFRLKFLGDWKKALREK